MSTIFKNFLFLRQPKTTPVEVRVQTTVVETRVKTYKDIWALLHFKLSAMKSAGKTEINLDDLLNKMKKLEGKTVQY